MNVLELLEKQWLAALSAPEQAALAEALQADPSLATEATAYQSLWAGFSALRAQQFRTQLAAWRLSYTATDNDRELIEWYHTGQLGAAARASVAQRAATDAAFGAELANYAPLYGALSAARTEQFGRQMQQWSAEVAPDARQPHHNTGRIIRLPLWRWASAAAVLLLAGWLGMQWYAGAYYQSTALATAAYQPPTLGPTMGATAGEAPLETAFAEAHQLFRQEEYAAAASAFRNVYARLDTANEMDEFTRKYLTQNTEWTLLLAELAAQQTGPDFESRLAAVAQNPNHTFAAAARELQQKLQSFWRKLPAGQK